MNKEKIFAKELTVSESSKWDGNKRVKDGYYSTIGLEIKDVFTPNYSKALLSSLSTSKLNINYRVEFKLSEHQKERLRKIALEKAILDATEKAKIIATTSKLELTGIANIEYKSTQGNFGNLNMIEDDLEYEDEVMPIAKQSNIFGNVDLNPKDREIAKVILIEWTYKKK
nr:SIMPL domain-containing protein [Ancylomarina sp. DW003]